MRASSTKDLVKYLNIDRHLADLIRKVWKAADMVALDELEPETREVQPDYYHPPSLRDRKMSIIDQLLDTSGVECLGVHRRTKKNVYYCNPGETYTLTVMFIGETLTISSMGNMVEANAIIPWW